MENGNNDQKTFGDNLFLLRKVHRLSQKEMAKIMGVSVYCVRKAEQGIFAQSLTAQVLVNLSRHFHIRPSSFFLHASQWSVRMLTHGEEQG